MIARLAITPGEPAGIGPDLVLSISQFDWDDQLIAVACPTLMAKRASELGLDLAFKIWTPETPRASSKAGKLWINPIKTRTPVVAGQLDSNNSSYVLDTLTAACTGCLNGVFDAMVTAPIHKGIINDAGIPFTGHTEFLEALTRSEKVVMMLATEGLKVALVTTHLPLREVADAITKSRLNEIIKALHHDLMNDFGLPNPRILVCGLNPHAGENGHMGREEIDIINPVLDQWRANGVNLIGPLPADTLFTEKHLSQCDAVLAMYHDQGLPVLKYKGFGNAVNITLGMSIIRTSVDHGTALDLAGSGLANDGSLKVALKYASEMAHNRLNQTK